MKTFKKISILILSFLMLFMFTACRNNNNADCNQIPVTIISIKGTGVSDKKLSMFVNDSTQLNALVAPSNATNKTIIWSIKNPEIATMSENGLLTAKTAGLTSVSASAGNITTSIELTVKSSVSIESLSFQKDTYEIFAQQNDAITKNFLEELVYNPVNVTYKDVTFELQPINDSPMEDVVISANGDLTVIKEKAHLNASYTLTATSLAQNNIIATTTIIIKHTLAESIKLRFSHEPAPNPTQTYTFPLSYSRFENLGIAIDCSPLGAMDKWNFVSDSPNIVKVNNSEKMNYGTFKIVAVGSAKITVTSQQNSSLSSDIIINVIPTTTGEEFIIGNSQTDYLNLTENDIASLTTDTRTYWNFDPEGETYKTDRANSYSKWHNTNTQKEMLNSGNGQSIFDGGFAICFDSWDWPADNEQTNLYVYNKIKIPENNNILKARVRTQSIGSTTGKGKFRIRMVNPKTYEYTFLQKDALVSNDEIVKPEIRPLTDIGVQDKNTGWITLDSVPDFELEQDWFYFNVPNEFKNKECILIFEVDDLHTSIDLGTDGCDRIQLICLYFTDNRNIDYNELRSKG